MIKLLFIAGLLALAIRWLTGAWPWNWLATKPSRNAELARARRLLAVSPNATHEEIRASYRRLATEMHPDRGGSNARLAALNAARDLLLSEITENRK